MNTAIANVVYMNNSQPMTDSKRLAEGFGLLHKNVLQKIQTILSETPDYFTELNFQPSEYTDPTGRTLKQYTMTRDGFMHIALTFTGKKGNGFRVQVIEAFNAMEAKLLQTRAIPAPMDMLDLLKLATGEIERGRAELKLAYASPVATAKKHAMPAKAILQSYPKIAERAKTLYEADDHKMILPAYVSKFLKKGCGLTPLYEDSPDSSFKRAVYDTSDLDKIESEL